MLNGKSAIVTGSTSGIGLGIAQGLARAGANVMMNGLGEAGEIERLREELAASTGVRVAYHGADMRVPQQIRDMIRVAEEQFGAVDILVNNAGVQFVSPVEEFPEDKWQAIIDINLSSSFHAIKAVLPGMRRHHWGRIINVASAHGLVASPFKSAYVAAKHGLVGLTKVVALECAEVGVTCNAICPGFTRTPLAEKQIQDLAREKNMPEERVISDVMLATQPTKRFVKVDELADLAVFLSSPSAASITGASLPVDGGWTAR